MAMGNLIFFPGAEETLRQRDERLDGVKLVLGDLDALAEAQRAICQDGAWRIARSYLLGELEIKLALLRELLGVE